MKSIFIPILSLLALSLVTTACSEQPDIKNLEGYWEIERADLPEGNTMEYSISTTIDHFTLESDSTGYKTKVMPQLDGSFITSGDSESFSIVEKDGKLKLIFTTPLSSHTETVLQLKEEQLILLNEREMKYTYKRFKKLELE